MTSAFDRIESTLAPIVDAAPPAGPPGGTGGFRFEPDELEAIVNDWLELADDYERSLRGASVLNRIDPPGDDTASGSFVDKASMSGDLYIVSLDKKITYCLGQAQQFKDALHDYLGIERVNVRTVNSAGERPATPGGI